MYHRDSPLNGPAYYGDRPSHSNVSFPSETRHSTEEYRPRSQSADTRRIGYGQRRLFSEDDYPGDIQPPSSSFPSRDSDSFRRAGDGVDFPSMSRGEHRNAEQHAPASPQQQQQFNSPAHNFTQHLRERSPSSSSALLNLLQRYPSARQSVYCESSRIVPAVDRPVETHVYRPPDVSASYPLVEVSVPRRDASPGHYSRSVTTNHYYRQPAATQQQQLPHEESLENSAPLNISYHNDYRSSPVYSSHSTQPLLHSTEPFRTFPQCSSTNGYPVNSSTDSPSQIGNRSAAGGHSFYTDERNNNHLPPPRNPVDLLDIAQLDSLLASVLDDNMNRSTEEWRNSFAQMQERFRQLPAQQDTQFFGGFSSSGDPTLPRRGAILAKSSSHHEFPDRSQLGAAISRRSAEAPELRKSGAIDSFWNQTVNSRSQSPTIQRIPSTLTAAERLQLLHEPTDSGRGPTPVPPQRMGSGSVLAARRDSYLSSATSPAARDSSVPSSSFSITSPNFSDLDNAVEELRTGVRSTGYSQSARRLGGCARFPTDEHAFSPPRQPIPSRRIHSPSPTDSGSETSSVYQVPTGLPHPRPKHNVKEQLQQAAALQNTTYMPRSGFRMGSPNFPVPSTGSVASRINRFENRPGTPTIFGSSYQDQAPAPMSPRSTVFRPQSVIHVDLGSQHSREPHKATTSFEFPVKHQPWNDSVVSDVSAVSPIQRQLSDSQLTSSPTRTRNVLNGEAGELVSNGSAFHGENGHTDYSSAILGKKTADSANVTINARLGSAARNYSDTYRSDQSSFDGNDSYRPSSLRSSSSTSTSSKLPPAPAASDRSYLPPPQQKIFSKNFKWYFPQGNPVKQTENDAALKRVSEMIKRLPNSKCTFAEMDQVCWAANLPVYWKKCVFGAVAGRENEAFYLTDFTTWWRNMTAVAHDEAARFVFAVSGGRTVMTRADLRPLIYDVIRTHPGMAFYRDATEFHEKYIDVVVTRIWWNTSRPFSNQMNVEEVRRCGLLDAIRSLEVNDDINKEMRFFSYEHFYVIYCTFWEIDTDHNMLVSRDDLSKYNNKAIPDIVVERIFNAVIQPTSSFMTLSEFAQFLMADEDKNHSSSIMYWFRVLDCDADGKISLYDMEVYQKAICEKLFAEGYESLKFPDVACQLLDAICPAERSHFTSKDLKGHRLAKRFFNSLVNWTKFYYQEVNEGSDPPRLEDETGRVLTDWEVYCTEQYEALLENTSEDGNDGSEPVDGKFNVYLDDDEMDEVDDQHASYHELL